MSSDQEQSPKDGTVIWRYMKNWQFEKLLDPRHAYLDWGMDICERGSQGFKRRFPLPSQGSLWFALPDAYLASDDKEGTFPALNCSDEDYCRLMAEYLHLEPEEAQRRKERFLARNTEGIRQMIRAAARLCGVSCWHENTPESAKMWSGFVPDGLGVTVKSTVGDLLESLTYVPAFPNRKAKPKVCAIRYVDLTTHFEPLDGCYGLLGLKCSCWKHEDEVRMIAKSPLLANTDTSQSAIPTDADYEVLAGYLNSAADKLLTQNRRDGSPLGFNLATDLSRLIAEIHVHPLACDSCVETIARRVRERGLDGDRVRRSELPPHALH